MKIKKKEVEPILTNLYFVKENKEFGLLTEEIPMSLRRFLQRIRKELIEVYEELRKDIVEISKEINKKVISQLPSDITEKEYLDPKSEHNKIFSEKRKEFDEEFKKEIELLFNEEFELKSPLASLAMIESINTKINYDFDLIEKIAQ